MTKRLRKYFSQPVPSEISNSELFLREFSFNPVRICATKKFDKVSSYCDLDSPHHQKYPQRDLIRVNENIINKVRMIGK